MVKKIRRKMKVIRKVLKPGESPDPTEPAEEVEEIEEEDQSEEEDPKEPEKGPQKDPISITTDDDDLGLAKTVTAPSDTTETTRRMKELIDAGASGGQTTMKKETPPEPKPVVKEPPVAPKPVEVPKPIPAPEPEVPITDMEPLDDIEKELEEDSKDQEFDKHRESMASTFDLQEKVMKEIEAELFKKEEEVRGKLEEIKQQNPDGLHEILDTVKDLDKDTIKDFVTAAETLYQGQFDKLPGNNDYWNDLKKKAGLEAKAAAVAQHAPAEQPPKRDKAEEYRRREKAIDVFKKSLFTSQSSGGLNKGVMSPFKMRADASKDGRSSHFFGPPVKTGSGPEPKKTEHSMTDFLKFGKADVAKGGDKDKAELEKALAEARLRLADAEKALGEIKMELANLRANNTDQLSELHSRVQELSAQIESKDKDLSDLKVKLDETKKSTTKFAGQKEMIAELEKAQRNIENLNYDIRTKNDVILGMEEQVKTLQAELERHKEAVAKASLQTDDKARLEQLEEIKIKEEELIGFEKRTQKNLEELKEIAKDNMKSEYRLKRKEMLLENLEKNTEYQRRELDKRATDVERSRHDGEVKVEMLDAREKEVMKKEEDLRLNKEKIEQEIENLDEQRKKIKNDLMEQARMDYRLDKRQQEIRLQEIKLKELDDSVMKKETLLKAKESEFKSTGGIDEAQIDEVLKMKTAELARKEEALQVRENELELKRRNLESKLKVQDLEGKTTDTSALMERLKAKESELGKREEELRKLESSLKDRWTQLQAEAKKGGEVKAPTTGPTVTQPTEGTEIKPLLKVRCVGCRELIPIYSTVRPLKVQCPKCSKVGVLK